MTDGEEKGTVHVRISFGNVNRSRRKKISSSKTKWLGPKATLRPYKQQKEIGDGNQPGSR